MSRSLSSFLAGETPPMQPVCTPVSDRFVNRETGEPELWEIRRITAKENAGLRKLCIHTIPAPGGRKGQYTQEFDPGQYQAKLAAACTVWPDLNDAGLQDSYQVMGAENLLTAMLTPGEFEEYSAQVLEVNGFQSKAELADTVKN